MGIRYLSEGNYEEAIIAFTAAIEIDPKRAEAYIGRGDAYVGSGETEDNLAAALADYETAIELDKTCAEAYLGLADVYIRQGEYDYALEVLQEASLHIDSQEIADKIVELKSGLIKDSSDRIRRQNYYTPEGVLESYYTIDYEPFSEQVWYSADGAVELREVFDEETGTNTVYDADGSVNNRIVYSFDEQGNTIGYTQFGPEGEVWGSRVYTFDESGNRTGFVDLREDGTVSQSQGTYTDEDGNQYTAFFDENGDLREYYIPTYDEDGEETGWVHYDKNGAILGSSDW